MSSIANLLQKGSPDRTKLECVADGFTAMARNLLLGRCVFMIRQEGEIVFHIEKKTALFAKCRDSFQNVLCNPTRSLGLFIEPLLALAFVIASVAVIIPAMATMTVGLILKKIALARELRAQYYHCIAKNMLAYAYIENQIDSLSSGQQQLQDARVITNRADIQNIEKKIQMKIETLQSDLAKMGQKMMTISEQYRKLLEPEIKNISLKTR